MTKSFGRYALGLAALCLMTAPPAHAAEDRAALMAVHRGGTIRMLAAGAAGTLDPQINYTLQFWQVYQFLYDGLLAFKKAPGDAAFEVVPDLAEAVPSPEDGGRAYTFKLREGVRFADGRDVTVDDVVASFRRIFKVASPTSGSFYNGIVGAAACLEDGASCTLEGGVVGDAAARTVTIRLMAPDPEFFYKLAVPHASILPADAPAQDGGSTYIPGTGAYMVESYDPNKRMAIVRNPHFKEWSVDAQPDGYADAMNYDFGLTDEAEVTAVQNGDADWMYDPPPADRLNELGTTYADQVHLSPLDAIYYLPLNTRLAPFDNEKARQALNYALDRKAIVNLFGGVNLASPTCQVLPPNFPGHEPYCPYTKNPGTKWSAPDLDKARQLVEESGTKGQKVTIIVQDIAVDRSIGVYVQSLLNQLGYDASVKALSQNIHFTYIQNTNNKVQISLSQWYKDYPAASNFLNVLFGCGSFREGSDSSINISGFCDPQVEPMIQDALAKGSTDQAAADRLWPAVDKAVTDRAAAAVLFNPKHVDFTSKRLGNFQFSNQFYWLAANAWVQ